MRTTQSIWLDEYEGLLPIPPSQVDRRRSTEMDAHALPEVETVSPHFELTPANLDKTTPLAFFE